MTDHFTVSVSTLIDFLPTNPCLPSLVTFVSSHCLVIPYISATAGFSLPPPTLCFPSCPIGSKFRTHRAVLERMAGLFFQALDMYAPCCVALAPHGFRLCVFARVGAVAMA